MRGGLSIRVAALWMLASGAVGVAEEVLLARWLGLLLGHAATAQATVLAAWMGGLGLGALLLGPGAERSPAPLRRYAALEAGAALLCLLWPHLAPGLADASVALPGALRALLLAATLLPPAILLGGTLPAMVRAATADPQRGGVALSWLYAANSAGAAIGAVGLGLGLLGWLGLSAALQAVCGLGLLVALSAALLARPAPVAVVQGDEPTAAAADGPVGRWLWLAGLGGMLALAIEALWMRLLATVLGASAYAFAGVVAVTVLGVALGSALVRHRGLQGPSALAHAARVALVATVVSLAAVLVLGERLPWWLALLRAAFAGLDGAVATLSAQALLTALVVLPSATALGALLPLAGAGVIASSGRVATGASWALAANTAGTVLGAALTQTLLVPALGLDGSLAALLAVAAILLPLVPTPPLTLSLPPPPPPSPSPPLSPPLSLSPPPPPLLPLPRGTSPLALAIVLAAALSAALVSMPWDARLLHAGAFRGTPRSPPTWSRWRHRLQRETTVFAADGAEASVVVLERDGDRVLKLQGKADASSRGDMLTQVLSAWLPMAAAAQTERVLIIGMGSGVTAGVAARLQAPTPATMASAGQGELPVATPGEAGVDVVELEPAVLRAAAAFDVFSHGASTAPTIRRHAADARGWLLRRPDARWDVLISEPSNPWMAGNGNLFTVEWLEAMRARLRPGGVLAQWFHAYEMSDALQTAVFATVAEVFPHVQLYTLHPGDVLMLASEQPLQLRRERVDAWLARPALRADLQRLDVAGFAGLSSLRALGDAGFRRVYGAAEARAAGLLRDDLPRLELEAPAALWRGQRARRLMTLDERGDPVALAGGVSTTTTELRDLLAQHVRFPSAPFAYRAALFDAVAARADEAMRIELGFTALRQGWALRGGADGAALVQHDAAAMRRRAAEVVGRLAGSLRPRALLLRAMVGLLDGSAGSEPVGLLRRCVALGDERAGRCGRLLARAEAERRAWVIRLLR
ncbi:MAG: hypothetical protein H6747_04385 [Deltaproteobacteria bacterium]|nr:hypothetical protein [Deltaproteobacteria bacterium]